VNDVLHINAGMRYVISSLFPCRVASSCGQDRPPASRARTRQKELSWLLWRTDKDTEVEQWRGHVCELQLEISGARSEVFTAAAMKMPSSGM
jgi:hypothetical protein